MNIEEEVRKLTREGYKPTEIVKKLGIDLEEFPVHIYREELRKMKGLSVEEDDVVGDDENMKEEEKKDEKYDEEEENNKDEQVILPYPKEIKPPEEWFEEFIKPFGVSKEFLRIYKQRIKRRKELPHPNELAADLADMKSGITNARAINYICEEYAYALEDYLREVGENEKLLRRSFGIKVSLPRPQPTSYFGYNPQYPYYDTTQQHQNPIPFYYPNPYPNPYSIHPYPPQQTPPPGNGGPFMQELKELREEIKRLKAISVSSKDDGSRTYINQLLSKIEKLEDELKQRDRERIEKLERELEKTRLTGMVTKEEIENMVRRTIEEYKGRLTPEDVKKIIEEEIKKLDIRLSKDDREYLIAKEKLQLEREKLQHEGKTKEMVANAIRTGLASVGEAIARTLVQTGTEKSFEVTGRQSGELWQFQCPNCNAIITAPTGSKIITCPKCGMSYTVELPTQIQQPQIPIQSPSKEMPKENQQITSEQQQLQTQPQAQSEDKKEEPAKKEEIKEKYVCPICGKEFDTEPKLRGHMIHHKRKEEQV